MRIPRTRWEAFMIGAMCACVIGLPTEFYVIKHYHLFPYKSRTNYRLMVSPTFTEQQQNEVRLAAQKWEKAVDNPRALTISVQVGACPVEADIVEGCVIPTTNIIDCSPAAAKAVGCARSGNGWAYTKLEIDVACGDIHTFSHLTQHEIGHLLGVYDTDARNRVMYHSVDCSEIQSAASQDVSQRDVMEYMRAKE